MGLLQPFSKLYLFFPFPGPLSFGKDMQNHFYVREETMDHHFIYLLFKYMCILMPECVPNA